MNTAEGSPMTGLGMTALHLRIAESKFTHNFVICDGLLDMEIILAYIFKRSFLSHMLWTKGRIVTCKGMVNS